MRLGFIDIAASYTCETPYVAPLGGTQSAVAWLAPELAQRGHAICLINQNRTSGFHHGIDQASPESLDDDSFLKNFDALVVNGRWTEKLLRGLKKRTAAPLIGWMHEAAFDTPFIQPWPEFSGMVFVSHWQLKINRAHLPASIAAAVIPNGTAPFFHGLAAAPRGATHAPVAVYAGSSKRGLLDLPHIIPALQAAHPDLRFRVYSDCVVSRDESVNKKFMADLLALPQVDHVGGVPQRELARAFLQADFFLGPNAYPETFCIALAEAMAAGLHPIITARAALPETAAGFATLVPFQNPDHPEWLPHGLDRESFVAAAAHAITQWKNMNEETRMEKRRAQMAYAATHYNWALHAKSWDDFIKKFIPS